jgi:hypothetical protein
MYEKSIYSPLTSVILSHVFSIQVSFSRFEVDRKVLSAALLQCSAIYFNTFNLKHRVYKIPFYLLLIKLREQIYFQ